MPDKFHPDQDAHADKNSGIAEPGKSSGYIVAILAVLIVSLISSSVLPYLDLANIVMLFQLPVVIIAARYGRGPAIFSTVLGVAAFDYGFVPPRFSFEISDIQYLVTFIVMLAVGLLISSLTANLHRQAEKATKREALSRSLYEFTRELSGTLETSQIIDIAVRRIESTFLAKVEVLTSNKHGQLIKSNIEKDGAAFKLGQLELGVAQWAYDHAKPAGLGTKAFSSSPYAFLPLVAPMQARGVLVIRPGDLSWNIDTEQGHLLQTYAALAAIALERQHYINVAQNAMVQIESERLRNSILSALSHDLRTPLTAMVGLSESLVRTRPALSNSQHELAQALHEETRRMSNMVSNLLDMARIQSGKVTLNLQWQYIEEVVGSALRSCRPILNRHSVNTELAPGLPLVEIDAVLIERVLCNLIENAAKYTPDDSSITISAKALDDVMKIEVRDNGMGLPPGQEEAVFEKFKRGERESRLTGTGLGLSICRAIIEAHHGKIVARNAPEGGACLIFTLPLGTPPSLAEEEGNAGLDKEGT